MASRSDDNARAQGARYGRAFGPGLAALASVMLHLVVLSAPGWQRPPPPEAAAIEARLLPPTATEPARAPVSEARPAAPPKPRRPRPPQARPLPELVTSHEEQAPPAVEPGNRPDEAPAPIAETAPERAEPPALPPPPAQPPAPAAVATDWPEQGRLHFLVMRGEQHLRIGRSVHSWQHGNGRYRLRAVVETTGLAAWFRPVAVFQESEGLLTASGLEPESFRSGRVGESAPRERVDFDRGSNRAILVAGSRRRELPLDPGAQDLLSVFHQFGVVGLRAASAWLVASGKGVSRARFETLGKEMQELPVGSLETIHMRATGLGDEQSTEVWLATDHRLLPVRIRFVDRQGEVYDQLVAGFEYPGVRLGELP